MKRFPRLTAVVLQALLWDVAHFSADAADTDQTLRLSCGWNAGWLEVEPRGEAGATLTADQVFRSDQFRIDRVASRRGFIGDAEFKDDPESLINQGSWDVWALNKESGESANVAVQGNHADLVHLSTLDGSNQYGVRAGDLPLHEEVRFYRPDWTKGEYNLVGFGFERAPTFASLMAGSGIKVDGPLGAKPHFPVRLPSPFLILRASYCLSAGTLQTAKSSAPSASFAPSMTSASNPPSPPVRGLVQVGPEVLPLA